MFEPRRILTKLAIQSLICGSYPDFLPVSPLFVVVVVIVVFSFSIGNSGKIYLAPVLTVVSWYTRYVM